MSDQYPTDEFDDLPDDGPIGVHRKPRSPWQTVLPFLVVLLVVPLLAWGATALIKGRDITVEVPPVAEQSGSQSEQSGAAVTPVAPLPEEGPSAAPDDPNEAKDPEVEQQPTETPANMAASIAVLNASGIEGLAGQDQARLAEAGFTGAWADNAADSGWAQNTVYYRDASLQPTAAKVGEVLGIPTVLEDAAITGELDVIVVLATAH